MKSYYTATTRFTTTKINKTTTTIMSANNVFLIYKQDSTFFSIFLFCFLYIFYCFKMK